MKGKKFRFFSIVLTAGGLLTLSKSTEITEQKKIGKPVLQPAIMTETNTNTMSLTQIIIMPAGSSNEKYMQLSDDRRTR